MFDTITAELKDTYRAELEDSELAPSEGLSEQDIRRWTTLLHVSRATLYDEIALFLARGFHEGALPYLFCDNIINDIHVVIIHADEDRPNLFWNVYLAFDSGEYHRPGDEDPVETYTRPQIAKIVATNAMR
jgi:hypothetical protein